MTDCHGDRGRRPHVALETTEPMSFGYGFISGLLSAILGIAGFGAVLSLRFPEYLSHAQLRTFYALPELRAVLHLMLVASFLLGSASAFLRANKMLAFTGIGFTLAAALIGGSQIPATGAGSSGTWLGLDFFVLNLVLYSAVFIPLERLFALRRAPVDGRSDLLLHQLAADRNLDDPHAEAGVDPVRLGPGRIGDRFDWLAIAGGAGSGNRTRRRFHPVLGSPRVSPFTRRCGTCCLERTTCRTVGRHRTVSTAHAMFRHDGSRS